MRVKSAVVLLVAALISACTHDAVVDYGTPPSASSTASSLFSPAADLDRVRDLVVGTWVRTESPSEIWDRYLIDGTAQTLDFSGRVLGSHRWELVSVTESDGVTVAAVQTEGDPRTRMLIGAIDWTAMTLTIPNRGTSYHYLRVQPSLLAGWYGGHGRGLTVRADGTGTGYYRTLCDDAGANCASDVTYDFVIRHETRGEGFATGTQVITAARPPSAVSLVPSDVLRLDSATDIVSTSASGEGAAFCGARARPSACGA
ncbi:hypothetical protein FK268_05070 [Tsukamurella sputi]|uniref:Lipoprotein n=1 Tax=Tsukamurella sputi TaxID=2591848 RepID=A0A5C5RWJ7_9ACTN|nr:hypothetical protein [Tsukamurella sputi]TWS26595.1 hypothetical protein FK268_05070 [Tsukamurella sputi]